MAKEDDEASAIEAPDGGDWMGRSLKVNKAKPREDRGSSDDRRGNGGYNYRR